MGDQTNVRPDLGAGFLGICGNLGNGQYVISREITC